MTSFEERGFESFIDRIVRSFLSKQDSSEQNINDVFKKLKQKAKAATSLKYLDIIGYYNKKAYSELPSSDEKRRHQAWDWHIEVDEAIKKRHAELRTVEKGFGVKVASVGVTKTERKQPPR